MIPAVNNYYYMFRHGYCILYYLTEVEVKMPGYSFDVDGKLIIAVDSNGAEYYNTPMKSDSEFFRLPFPDGQTITLLTKDRFRDFLPFR